VINATCPVSFPSVVIAIISLLYPCTYSCDRPS
jgi:hypothetical protein